MVDVRQVLIARRQADGAIAIKAAPLLVTVQAVAAAGDIYAPLALTAEQQLLLVVILHRNQVARHAHLPGLLHQTPARVGLMDQVVKLLALRQAIKVIGQANALCGFTLVDKKALRYLGVVHVVKRVDNVIKTAPDGDLRQLRFAQLTLIKLRAGVQKLAAVSGSLLRRVLQMLTQMAGKRSGQRLKGDQLAGLCMQIVKRVRQGELIGGGVLAEKDYAAPVVLQRRVSLIEAHRVILMMLPVQGSKR